MKKISQDLKKKTNGGLGVMAAWVAVMAVTMIASTIGSTITSVVDKVTTDSSNSQKSYSTSNAKKSTYVRMSPFPNRSAVSMWM